MRRLSVFPLFALASLCAISGPAGSALAEPHLPRVQVEVKLKASDGLTAQLENEGEEVSLIVRGHRQSAEYTALHGKVSPERVEARFGKLGEVSVEFQPTRTVEAVEPPRGCEGEVWTTKVGAFVGTIHFRGEGGYVEIDASRARGEVRATSDWTCPYRYRREEQEGDVASLVVRRPNLKSYFAAFAIRDPQEGNHTVFVGGAVERREGMRISRAAAAAAQASTFVFDHEQGTATVVPPWPFRGRATFRRVQHGPDSWHGSVRAPMLGAGVVAFTGADFSASLKRDFPSD